MVKRAGPLRHFYYKVERKKGGKVAKVATARKLLEWMYHMMRDGKTFKEVEKLAEIQGKGELAKKPGLVLRPSIRLGSPNLNDIVWLLRYGGMGR